MKTDYSEAIDKLVNHTQWAPYRGWWSDYITADYTPLEREVDYMRGTANWQDYKRAAEERGEDIDSLIRPDAMPAIQQHREEFYDLISVLEEHGLIGGKCLQLGLGKPGASHVVWEHLFNEAWTIELEPEAVSYHLARSPHSENIVCMDTRMDQTVRLFRDKAPFDFLLIDADHAMQWASMDYTNYGPMVREGGLIAIHDAFQYPYYDVGQTMWMLVERVAKTADVKIIGEKGGLGIAWLMVRKSGEGMTL